MAQVQRQTKLFAAEDYTAVYESYINANFQAYDFDTIRDSMVSYIRDNYPENYNDWVESAEFVSLLDVIARFGHSLAFRVDLNARNNFLSTAERSDSVYKLAEFLGYTPRRNTTANGFVKIVSVKTNEDVIGSSGTTLASQEIQFENSTSQDNLDNFITVMNAVFASTNPFGSPRKQVIINNVTNQFYNMNNNPQQIAFSFNGLAQGTSTTFNAYSVDYNTDTTRYEERDPDPSGAFTIVYKNDGQGILSNNTGFFFGLKEGNLDFQDFNVSDPISGMTLDVDASDVNNSDIWVQTINEDGSVIKTWTKVNEVFGNNVIYNNLSNGIRDIYSVKTLEDNKVSIVFADSTFGNLPKGIVRVWFRQSLNETYSLRPDDIGLKRINMRYKGADNNTYTATFVVQLKSTVNTASSGEDLFDIKESAPRAYASQNRMITADDYNGLLTTTSDNIKKVKAVNRTHSGFSRYVDLKDPTGAYSNLRLFATDGTLAKTEHTKETIASDTDAATVFDKYIKKFVADDELVNLYYDKYATTFTALKNTFTDTYLWNSSTQYPLTGYFTLNNVGQGYPIYGVGKSQSTYLKYIKQGALCKFTLNGNEYFAQIERVYNNGLGVDNASGTPTGITPDDQGAIGLDRAIPQGAQLDTIYPALSRQFTATERSNIIAFIQSKQTFALKYDYVNSKWEIVERDPLPTPANHAFPTAFDVSTLVDHDSDPATPTRDNNWVIHISYTTTNNIDKWTITQRVVRYTLASSQIEFSNITNEFFMDGETRKKKRDEVLITDLSATGTPSSKFYIWGYDFVTDGDKSGIYDPSKVILSIVDSDQNERPQDPTSFVDLVPTSDPDQSVSNLRFEWTHVPATNELVDPSFTNLIDVFTLTNQYDTNFRAYLEDATGLVKEPMQDTVSSLNASFEDQTDRKAMSDSIVYRPIKYKIIFGPKSDSQLRAKFRVIKTAGTKFTDNEIKNQVVKTIQEYFKPENWDFGETFFFTELAAYVHKELSGTVSSFVVVPLGEATAFGDLFQITPLGDELLIPDVSVTDVDIIDSITTTSIRQAQGI